MKISGGSKMISWTYKLRYKHRFTNFKKIWIDYFYDGVDGFAYRISTGDCIECRLFSNHKLIARQATYTGV